MTHLIVVCQRQFAPAVTSSEPFPPRFCSLITAPTKPVWGCSSATHQLQCCLLGDDSMPSAAPDPCNMFPIVWRGRGGFVTVVLIQISEVGNVRLLLFQSLRGLYKEGRKRHARRDARLDPITSWQDCQTQITATIVIGGAPEFWKATAKSACRIKRRWELVTCAEMAFLFQQLTRLWRTPIHERVAHVRPWYWITFDPNWAWWVAQSITGRPEKV